ncbi:DUF2127 domain-containing protein [Millisia brevis]|uniref:DUF2127 domain-containing protein n=1 Tax=Millisia brevis TaxID=264148 RepID=UPI000836933D|nr:DUF2127 domain-containing protein [Millisia brevis]
MSARDVRDGFDLVACGIRGHVTYAPTEADLAGRLSVEAPRGTAWRCLRCGDYVLGEPHGSGPADQAPMVLRGAALRDLVILRVLAVERLLRGVILIALAAGIWWFQGQRAHLQSTVESYVPLLQPIADRLGVTIGDLPMMHRIESVLNAGTSTILGIGLFVLALGALELVEAIGLWSGKRWGEYVAVVATSIFIPFEVYELIDRITFLRVAALVVNVFLVVYLVWTKRLFGVRGGLAAREAQLHGRSLIEIERSAGPVGSDQESVRGGSAAR